MEQILTRARWWGRIGEEKNVVQFPLLPQIWWTLMRLKSQFTYPGVPRWFSSRTSWGNNKAPGTGSQEIWVLILALPVVG